MADRMLVELRDRTQELALLLSQDTGPMPAPAGPPAVRDQALSVCSAGGAAEIGDFRATSLATLTQMLVGSGGLTLLLALRARSEGRADADLGEDPVAEGAALDPVVEAEVQPGTVEERERGPVQEVERDA